MNERIFDEQRYWFRAKSYGWGWGLPITWQGWASLVIYLLLVVLSARVFPPDQHPTLYMISIFFLSAVLIFVCWLKGEPAAWRWGENGLR